MLLVETSLNEAAGVCDRLARRIDGRNVSDVTGYEIEVDMFLAEYDAESQGTIAELLAMAEQQMTGTGVFDQIGSSGAVT